MHLQRIGLFTLAALMTVGVAAADIKVVTQHHQDAFSMMGQSQPATDEEHTTWIGDGRMRMDQGSTSFIVSLADNKVVLVNHDNQSYSEIDLPIDLESLMPPGMGEQMKAMMNFDVTVTPTDETKTVGGWEARRYDMSLSSAMVNMEQVLWAAKDTPVDVSAYVELYGNVVSLQPGMESMMSEMKKIDGFVVSQESTAKMPMMGDAAIGSKDAVTSIEEVEAPAGTYEPPAGYARKDFNFMEMMQK